MNEEVELAARALQQRNMLFFERWQDINGADHATLRNLTDQPLMCGGISLEPQEEVIALSNGSVSRSEDRPIRRRDLPSSTMTEVQVDELRRMESLGLIWLAVNYTSQYDNSPSIIIRSLAIAYVDLPNGHVLAPRSQRFYSPNGMTEEEPWEPPPTLLTVPSNDPTLVLPVEAEDGTLVRVRETDELYVRNGVRWVRVQGGTSGQVLQTGSGTDTPSWIDPEIEKRRRQDEENRLRDEWAASPWVDFFESIEDGSLLTVETLRMLLDDPDATQTFVELIQEYAQRLATASHYARAGKTRSFGALDGVLVAPRSYAQTTHYTCGYVGHRMTYTFDDDASVRQLGEATITSKLIAPAVRTLNTYSSTGSVLALTTHVLESLSRKWALEPWPFLKDPNEPLLGLVQHPFQPLQIALPAAEGRPIGRFVLLVEFRPRQVGSR